MAPEGESLTRHRCIRRTSVVVLSTEEYEELEAIKLSRLRSEIDEGLDALRREDFIELDQNELLNAADEIKATGRVIRSQLLVLPR